MKRFSMPMPKAYHIEANLKAAMIWTRAMMVFLFGDQQELLEKLGRFRRWGVSEENDGAVQCELAFLRDILCHTEQPALPQPNWRPVNMHRYFIEFYRPRCFPPRAFDLYPCRARGVGWTTGAAGG